MKLSGIDLNKLFVFYSVIHHNGYRDAASELHITKAAISQSITTLETQLKKKLFLRINNRLQPTEDALKLYQELAIFQTHLLKAVDQFTQEKHTLKGTIRIGAYYEFTKSKLMPIVEKFLIENKNVNFKFRFESPSKLEKLLNEKKIDFSISIFPHKKSKNIISQKLFKQELVLIAHKSLCSERADFKIIKELPIIDYYADHLLIKRWAQHNFRNPFLNPNIRLFAASAEMVLECVRRKLGIGVIPKYVAEPYLSLNELIIVSPKNNPLFDFIWLNQNKDFQNSPVHIKFMNCLLNSNIISN